MSLQKILITCLMSIGTCMQAHATTVVMIHGGGWKYGDADSPKVVKYKKQFFDGKGVTFKSLDYPLIPHVTVSQQINHLKKQIQDIQNSNPEDPMIVMGHSAGAHLALMVASGLPTVKGVVSLDTAAIDVEAIMRGPHFKLYDDAFPEPSEWKRLSPLNTWSNHIPVYLVCSTQRRLSCLDNQKFAMKYQNVTLLPIDKSHGDINGDFGKDKMYTEKIWNVIQKW